MGLISMSDFFLADASKLISFSLSFTRYKWPSRFLAVASKSDLKASFFRKAYFA